MIPRFLVASWSLLVAVTTAGRLCSQVPPMDHCAAPAPDRPSADIYCLELVPSPRLDPSVGAYAVLDLAPSPFTIPVTVDGRIRYRPRLLVEDLAPLHEAANGGELVVWVTTPAYGRWTRVGTIATRETVLDEISLDQFVLVVTVETDLDATAPSRTILLRGRSPSTRLQPPDFVEFASGVISLSGTELRNADDHAHDEPPAGGRDWGTVPMPPGFAMLPAEMALRPDVGARRPDGTGELQPVRRSSVMRLATGDSIMLVADEARKRVHGREEVVYAFNGQIPGPLLWVDRGAVIRVRFENRLDQPSTIHWHGLRLDAAMDGTPHVSQAPVPPGGGFTYEVRFPDAGLYWYHPHVREEMQQDLGLAGNIMVRGMDELPPAAREEVVMLDDLLVGEDGIVPYGDEAATHALMGRFGNLLLVNGEPHGEWTALPGQTIRFWFTNAANTRTFNLSITNATMRLVAGDMGPFSASTRIPSLVIAPAERYAVDVTLDASGPYHLVNRVRAIDHLMGVFRSQADTMGTITTGSGMHPRAAPLPSVVDRPRDTSDEIAVGPFHPIRPDITLEFGLRLLDVPFITARMMQLDSSYFHPVEWSGTMPMMNWATTANQAHWFVRDAATGGVDADAAFTVRRGDTRVLRLVNLRTSLHAMQHPIHLHGQRFRVLAVNGVPPATTAWKDTVLLPAGGTVDLLVEFTNPGRWMLHCHIAEHIESGMMTTFTVEE